MKKDNKKQTIVVIKWTIIIVVFYAFLKGTIDKYFGITDLGYVAFDWEYGLFAGLCILLAFLFRTTKK